ncbi:hypothetical protein BDV28DRAFT_133745 [Aspergillus coremiiformis]|uniref:Uncharacterized protein n=1 Tax=Aspergillus coremiiformis TaxID=138285 RepID=A0A5N6Z696_9EURO|nr:hypothetical protein BDV28DRAFT_133745 [Aspergillus coremiiformis]
MPLPGLFASLVLFLFFSFLFFSCLFLFFYVLFFIFFYLIIFILQYVPRIRDNACGSCFFSSLLTVIFFYLSSYYAFLHFSSSYLTFRT